MRGLLLSEALVLGVAGTGIGVPLGLAAMRFQSWLLTDLGFLPPDFTPRWQPWILGVSAGAGVGVALVGVLAASRRAAKVRPLDAVRETGTATRVMTAPRWFFGILFAAGATALMIVSRIVPGDGVIPITLFVGITGAIAMSAFSPLVVPIAGRLAGFLLRGSTIGLLAQANLRDGVRRSASTAAPLLVLVALLVSQAGTLGSIAEATRGEQERAIAGDLVVDSTGAAAQRIAGLPGVETASTEVGLTMPVLAEVGDGKPKTKEFRGSVLAVDPVAYQRTHPRPPAEGSLADLHGDTIAVGPKRSGERGLAVGAVVRARTARGEVPLRVVAALAPTMNGGASFLVPREVAGADVLAAGKASTIVRAAPGADVGALASRIRAEGAGNPAGVAAAVAAKADGQRATNSGIMAVLMGLAGLYALVAVVNAVVIAAAERRREFAVARMTGLSRAQVVRMAVVESWVVTAIGLALGCLAASGTLFAIGSATGRITGVAAVAVPWELLGAVVAGAFAVVGVTSLWSGIAATRPRPVTLAASRE
ncbi:FtsX-like permease family protein [Amycolatopsis minnesotensis]|uniref:ABC3 transporter permease C-terminal domain-containing protein n=1 Tax=Amycolatopsis minnesotensis TaxID=337894 RepID=A0ABP5BTD8_9PSEU